MSMPVGVPDPAQWIRPQTIATAILPTDRQPARTLYEGATVANATTYQCPINCGGASSVRARFKSDIGGTLALSFVRPDGKTKYTAGNPTNVAVTANTETLIDSNTVYGEGWALLEFTASGSGSITMLDVMAL